MCHFHNFLEKREKLEFKKYIYGCCFRGKRLSQAEHTLKKVFGAKLAYAHCLPNTMKIRSGKKL